MPREASARELFVLGRLSAGRTYGHEINRTIKASRADLWVELSEKHVYYVLRKFEREGLVTSGVDEEAGRERRIYELTDLGRRTLSALLTDESFARDIAYSAFDTVVATLGCTDALGDQERTTVLRTRMAELDRRLADEYAPLMGRHVERQSGAAARVLYEKGKAVTQAERAWLSVLIDEVERNGWGAFVATETSDDEVVEPCGGVSARNIRASAD